MFQPLGTPQAMTVRGIDGSTYEMAVYPSPISGLGICKPSDPERVAEWCVVHEFSGTILVMVHDGQSALYASEALAFAASSAGAFWEWPLHEITGNAVAMRRCSDAVRVYAAQ